MIIGPSNFVPRPYQAHAIDGGDPHKGPGIMPCLARYQRVLAVLATGLGKTEIFLALMRRYIESARTPAGKRGLILAHRDELVSQPIERAAKFGLQVAREQGDETAVGKPERVIASTIQTMIKRYKLYSPDEIGFIVIDEAHHAAADTYQEVINYFPDAYLLGVTATPQRLDGIGLGEVFKAQAFRYSIRPAIDDGWLVPLRIIKHVVEGFNLEDLCSRGGDIEVGKLGEMVAANANYVAKELVELVEDRATIVFCPTVAASYAMAECLRKYTNERVECAFAGTPKPKKRARARQQDLLEGVTTRQDMIDDFKAGRVKFLVNCALFTEGFDAPNARCVVLVRPTEAAALTIQMVGRGTRPLPGVVDRPELADDPAGRCAAIAASAKPDLLVVDFTCNSQKHDLSGPVDALAGKLTPEERLALTKIPLVGETLDQAIQLARIAAAEEAARREAELRELASHSYDIDPFHPVVVLGIKDLRDDPAEARASAKMTAFLARNGVANASSLSASTAKKLQGTIIVRDKLGLATLIQATALQRAGVPVAATVKMKSTTAADLVAELRQNGSRRPRRWDSVPVLGGQAAVTLSPR